MNANSLPSFDAYVFHTGLNTQITNHYYAAITFE